MFANRRNCSETAWFWKRKRSEWRRIQNERWMRHNTSTFNSITWIQKVTQPHRSQWVVFYVRDTCSRQLCRFSIVLLGRCRLTTGMKLYMVYLAETTLLSHRSKSGLPGIKMRSGSFSFFFTMMIDYPFCVGVWQDSKRASNAFLLVSNGKCSTQIQTTNKHQQTQQEELVLVVSSV